MMKLIGYVYSGSRAYQDHDPGCSIAEVWNLQQGVHEVSLILCPFRNISRVREPALPSNHLEALR